MFATKNPLLRRFPWHCRDRRRRGDADASASGDNCCSGTIDCEPDFTPQLPPDCLELRDQAYREEQKRYYARWQEIQEWEETMLKNSDQIHRSTVAVITAVRDENILIATGQYALKATAINVSYVACLGAGRVDITGRIWARCSALYGTLMTALTSGHNDKLDKIKEDANESLEEAGIAKIQRDALIKENARKRRIENIAAHNDAVSQIWEDWRDCLLEFANSGSEDEESEEQD